MLAVLGSMSNVSEEIPIVMSGKSELGICPQTQNKAE